MTRFRRSLRSLVVLGLSLLALAAGLSPARGQVEDDAVAYQRYQAGPLEARLTDPDLDWPRGSRELLALSVLGATARSQRVMSTRQHGEALAHQLMGEIMDYYADAAAGRVTTCTRLGVLLGVALLALMGFLAGAIPAYQARRLTIADALRRT